MLSCQGILNRSAASNITCEVPGTKTDVTKSPTACWNSVGLKGGEEQLMGWFAVDCCCCCCLQKRTRLAPFVANSVGSSGWKAMHV